MQSLIFFNKEGDNLNFIYDSDAEIWRGDLIFHENSDDTFKTIGLYIFEKIPSFEYERPGDMQLEKFQLFNEYRFNISGNSYFTQSITKVSLPNVDTEFFSKWIIGDEFDKKFPVGSQIRFDQKFLEFQNYNKSYTVVKTKKNGIMIMTDLNNQSFSMNYGYQIDDLNSYTFNEGGETYSYSISGVNSIGVYNYIKNDYTDNLSSWSEPNFYDRYFNGRVLNLTNTDRNDGVYSIKNTDLIDKVYTRYFYDARSVTQSLDFRLDVSLKTELPTVYSGGLGLTNSRIYFNAGVPKILKPGTSFYIPSSTLNDINLTVSDIPYFNNFKKITNFPVGYQVIFESNIYECIESHTWSATETIFPTNTDFWSEPTYLSVNTQLEYENFGFTEIQLTTNKFSYTQSFTQSFATTLGSHVEKFSSDLSFFNIDYYIKDKKLYADLVYPSNYADVKFLVGTNSINVTNKINIYEKNVEIQETLKPEVNKNFCQNFIYNIVFTDLDEYGVRIIINGQVYYQSVEFIYDGLEVSMERTIDKTLRNWMTTWYLTLAVSGIIPKLKFTGKAFSVYFNTLQLTTEYPNVPINFSVQVGTTANYYIPRAQVLFNKIGPHISVTINGRSYDQVVTYTNGQPNIPLTLEEWSDNYSIILDGYGISVEPILSMLSFGVKKQDTRFDISVKTNTVVVPGLPDHVINNLFVGNFGALLTSNSVVLTMATYSFEDEPFATGQLVTINNSNRTWNNQEYNIEYLGPKIINLSYQGPFWPTLDPLCNVSPFINIALNNGFGATGCTPPSVFTPGGEFNSDFSSSFKISWGGSNSYFLNTDFPTNDTKRFVDMIYLSLVNRIYVMGERLTVIDSVEGKVVDEIDLPGLSASISMTFNEYNNYIYCLSTDKIYLIDPVYPRLDHVINFSSSSVPLSCGVNPDNGDVYVSYGTKDISVWYFDNYTSVCSMTFSSTTDRNYYRFAYNRSEKDIYVTSDDSVDRINGSSRTLQITYDISGVKPDIHYLPQNSSIYLFDTNKVNNINNGVITPIDLDLKLSDWLSQPSGTTSNFNDIEFFDKDRGLIVGDRGVILITENGGENWNAETNFTQFNLNALSILPDGFAIAGGENGTLIYSVDYGNNWTNFTPTIGTNNILDIEFASLTSGYVALTNNRIGIYSVPGGIPAWSTRTIAGVSGDITSLWVNSDSSVIFAVGKNDIIIKTSYNIISNSIQVRRSSLNAVVSTPTAVIIGGLNGIIFRSTDSVNWFTRDPLFKRDFNSIYHVSTGNKTWMVGSNGAIRVSTNFGNSWGSQNSGVTSVNLNSVYFIDGDIGLAGGDNGTIIWTENGGTSWNTHQNTNSVNWTTNKINGVTIISHTGGLSTKLVIGDNGTILLSTSSDYRKIRSVDTFVKTGPLQDGVYNNLTIDSTTSTYGSGATFNVVISNGDISSIIVVNGGRGFVSGDIITILNAQLGNNVGNGNITFRVGTTISLFTSVASNTPNNLNKVLFLNSSQGIIIGDNALIMRTTNGGQLWNNSTISGAGNLISICNFQSTVWVGSTNGRVYRSTDGGGVFSLLATVGSVDINSISFRDASNGTLVDSWGRIYNTINGGLVWDQVKFDYSSVDFTDDNTGWVAGENGLVLRTTDGGVIWNYAYSGTTASINSINFADSNIGYYSGPEGIIFKSSAGGDTKTWVNQSSGSNNLNNFAFTDTNTGYVAGDGGSIFKIERDPPAVRNLVFNKNRELMFLSTPDGIRVFDLDGNLVRKGITPEYGPLAVNELDGDVYLASQNNQSIFVFDSINYFFKHSQHFPEGRVRKVIYNPDRQSVFGIIPNNVVEQQSIFELSVILDTEVQKETEFFTVIEENNYGTLDINYQAHPDLWLKTREYIRRPRENYNDDPLVDLIWKWADDQVPEIFMYDFSGNQLPTGTPLSYIGPKPLPIATLNRKPNLRLDRIGLSEYQKTIFEEITHTLLRVDDSEDLQTKPTPIEIFLGFRSDNEGVVSSVLELYKRESISFTVSANSSNSDVLHFSLGVDADGLYGLITFDVNSRTNFRQDENGVSRGLKPGQDLRISVTDQMNKKDLYISTNNGITVRIREVFTKYLVVTFGEEIFTDEFTQIDDFPKTGNITYLTVKFEVIDKLVGQFNIIGQTEIEDIRYKIELSNTGHLVNSDDSFIFKEYDINEQGVDWTFLNRKRKELLMVRDQIFPYIGSYKSIINAINYFGYNDLELYEYYRNIDRNSKDFFKLFKVEIPDIFDNSVAGWTENDFIKQILPTPKFQETNLFNLTYKITDKGGVNVLMYSLSEVILKLQGLKVWLQKRIIPISHKILDITGRADFVGENSIVHKNYDIKTLNIRQNFTPIDFKLEEAYLMPINSGSSVYTCQLRFFTAELPEYTSFPDYFTLRIRTYKTYDEWYPFDVYSKGDKVSYYGRIYESVLDNNKLKNPRKYESILNWDASINYVQGDYVKYQGRVYQYVNVAFSFDVFGQEVTTTSINPGDNFLTTTGINPVVDIQTNQSSASWIDMTEWIMVDLKPVQNLMEYRLVATMSLTQSIVTELPLPGQPPPTMKISDNYNFTIDTSIDPFIVIEVTSDNGYGQNFTQKRNYEIRGLNNVDQPVKYIDQIGPFQPIAPITDIII